LDYQVVLNDELYSYLVQYSKRARYLRIKLSPEGVITLVVPKGVSLQEGQAFLDSKKPWLEKHLQNLSTPKPFTESRPASLLLRLLDEHWSLVYQYSDNEHVVLEEQLDGCLVLTGCVDNKELVFKAIGSWLKAKAEKALPSQLSKLAEQHGFHYNRVTIRGQKTRWGSCSSQKNINLNYKLLFLEQALVDYVLIHELCHTLEMNHSKRFWKLVADCDKNYQQHDRLLNQVGREIPI
jgi:predicted metal-dependent hydrolase